MSETCRSRVASHGDRLDELAVLVDTLAADAERTERRIEALEARPYAVPGEVVSDGGHTHDDHCPVCFGCCGGESVPPCPPGKPACDPPCNDCGSQSEVPPICGEGGPSGHPCWRDPGHAGDHEASTGGRGFVRWSDPAPAPCGSLSLTGEVCDLDEGHDGDHSRSITRLTNVTWSRAPVPQWRALVAEQYKHVRDASNPLGEVLLRLSDLTTTSNDARGLDDLARIVAICEAQVGDGWQANPDRYMADRHSVELLAFSLAEWHSGQGLYVNWKLLGGRASSWLKSLTEDAS